MSDVNTGQGAGPETSIDRTGVAARAVEVHKIYGEGDAQVAALDGVTIDFYSGEYTAVMGPSGSGKSTLMHCMAALDTVTTGQVLLGDEDLSQLNDKKLTRLRRDKIGFVFQAFNLVPTLTAQENILLPMSIAGRKPDQEWFDTVIDTVGLGDRLEPPAERAVRRPAAAGGLRARAGVTVRRSSSPTSRPATWTRTSGAEVLGFLRRSVDEYGRRS